MTRPEQLTIQEQRREAGLRVVRVEGDIDLSCTAQVESACASCLTNDETAAIVVDLAGTGFLDSSGIAMLERVRRQARSAGVPLAVVANTPRVVRSLEISGATATLVLTDSLEAACAAAAADSGTASPGDGAR